MIVVLWNLLWFIFQQAWLILFTCILLYFVCLCFLCFLSIPCELFPASSLLMPVVYGATAWCKNIWHKPNAPQTNYYSLGIWYTVLIFVSFFMSQSKLLSTFGSMKQKMQYKYRLLSLAVAVFCGCDLWQFNCLVCCLLVLYCTCSLMLIIHNTLIWWKL